MRRLLVLGVLLAPAIASAQTSTMNGATVDIAPYVADGNGGWVTIGPTSNNYQLARQFNLARCLCAEAGDVNVKADTATKFAAHFSYGTQPTSAVTDPDIEVWMGPNCDTLSQTDRDKACGGKKDTITGDKLQSTYNDPFSVKDLMDPAGTGSCPDTQGQQSIYVVTDPEHDGMFNDHFSTAVDVDSKIPIAPTAFTTASGGEQRIVLGWTALGASSDVYSWQALCAEVDPSSPGGYKKAFDTPKAAPRYETASTICGDSSGITLDTIPGPSETDGGVAPDAMIVPDAMPSDANTLPPPDGNTAPESLPPPLAKLDPDYICADQPTATADSIEIPGLENGKEYYVVLVAIDKAGNPHAVTTGTTMKPIPSTDFWEELQQDDDHLKGGFCLIADTYGDGGGITSALRDFRDQDLGRGSWLTSEYYGHVAWLGELARDHVSLRIVFAIVLLPVVALALAWHFLGLPLTIGLILLFAFRKRVRRGMVIAAILLAPALASAQEFNPYWDQGNGQTDNATSSDAGSPSNVHWHVGMKFGPYVPQIDAQVPNDPYKTMFGTKTHWLGVLEVDRIIWHAPGGQLGAGGSVGWFRRAAHSFIVENGMTTDQRSEADVTKFDIVPIAANAVYRLTYLDDEYGIPVIPYARAGLSYYVWWITAPDGNFAVVNDNKARGASLGVQGSLGLAIRAERIDPSAASSMADSGIEHAGFYGEYQVGWVDGFGSSKKLAVGDATWFAGVDFEF